MTSKKQVVSEIEYLFGLKTTFQTYQEIAATRMQRTRNSVLAFRDFLLGINTIFQQVKFSYKIKPPSTSSGQAQRTFLKTNGKTLFVFISANTGLYGGIIKRTFDVFIRELKKQNRDVTDVAIIGRLGVKLFQEEFPKKLLSFFELSDNKIDHEVIKKIIPYLIQYEKVIVFYEQFQSIITSLPIATSISGDRLPWEKSKFGEIKYNFEPSLEKVMAFFEKEIFASIFEQVVYESLLAKFASRMVALEDATENIQNNLKQAILQKDRIKHQEQNKKQNERLSGMSLWQTP